MRPKRDSSCCCFLNRLRDVVPWEKAAEKKRGYYGFFNRLWARLCFNTSARWQKQQPQMHVADRQRDHIRVLHAIKRMAWWSASNRLRADVTAGAPEISSGGSAHSALDSVWRPPCLPESSSQNRWFIATGLDWTTHTSTAAPLRGPLPCLEALHVGEPQTVHPTQKREAQNVPRLNKCNLKTPIP